MKPYYEDTKAGIVIYCGDCREILPQLPKVDLVLTDPPYGMNWDTNSKRFTGGNDPQRRGKQGRNDFMPVIGDNEQFDPRPFIDLAKDVILWGCNHFSKYLPVGTTLVWIKKYDAQFQSFLSDAELAWMKGGCGVYCKRDTTMFGESSTRLHPTQKPVGIMQWCLLFADKAETILDPFMGSGTTLRAAKDLGRKAIGIEIEEKYCEIAARRLAQEVLAL